MAKIIKPPYFESVVNAGEKRLMDYLEIKLPDNYYLIPNIELASTDPRNNQTRYWEYDLIVVAPHAVFNIENKDWKGRIEGDDNNWYVNDRQMPNPLRTGRQKTAVLASKFKEHNPAWGKIWVLNMLTLSYNNVEPPILWKEAEKLTFQLNDKLIAYLTTPEKVGKWENAIEDIQKDIVQFLIGKFSEKSPNQKREIEGYEIIEILQQESNFVEYLVKQKGISSNIRKRIKEYSLQVAGLSRDELHRRELQIQNGFKALESIGSNPFITNVHYRLDNENHIFYETTDFMEDDSLRSVARIKTFTFQEKILIIKNIISALKAAHEHNVFHRDINPENIYYRSGYAILGNFGKSYFIDHHEQGYTVQATINENNATAYHPLELTVGDANRSSDVYSLGVLIYWLFTGQEPFKTPYDLDKMGGTLPANKLPSALNPTLPKWLDELCNRMILVDEDKRFDSMTELEIFLDTALKETETLYSKPVNKPAIPNIDAQEFKEGDRVGDYIIYKVLGKGGYSQVFKVKHSLQGKEYALKLFHESVNIASVKDEYESLKRLSHDNIVKFEWNGTIPSGQFYTLTEFLDGENLSNYTRTDARLPIRRVYQVAQDILSALVLMQSQEKPILHRDIKPHNIMWDSQKRFVLIDFNVASFAENNKDFVGTNPYLAPDLITEGYKVNWDTSADTFALGVTLYELVCKQYPWHPSRMPLISKEPENPKNIEPRLSDAFVNFLLKAIQTDGAKRFASAKEMLGGLESIGIDHVLETFSSEIVLSSDEVVGEQDFVKYINSLYSQSKHGNSGTRASFESSYYDAQTYTPTKLDKQLIPAVLDGQFKLLIITGNAGDGKTAFIRKIEEAQQSTDLKRFKHRNGAQFRINGVLFESNYDGSQDEEERANNEVLESFFQPFEHLTNYSDAKEGRIIAINEGRLVEFLGTSSKHLHLASIIEEYFYKEGHHNLPNGLMIINLNLRSVTAQNSVEPSLFRQQIKILTQKKLWLKCENCPLSHHCFIKYNVDSFNDSAAGEDIITRMEWLLRTASLKRELHITMRDLRSFIAFTLTRDYHCDDIDALYRQNGDKPEIYWQHYYFNITNPYTNDSGNQDRLIKLLRETDIGEVAIPDLDRDLFFGKHESKNYIEFGERTIHLLELFNIQKTSIPAYEQNPEWLISIKSLHKIYIRHQYFEGRSSLLKPQNQIANEDNTDKWQQLIPSFLLRLPYHSVFKFVKVLNEGDIDNLTKQSISRAISLNEGCDNTSIDRNSLVLSSTEIKDPLSKSFRLFSLDDFELLINRTQHLVKYLEYEPDSLTFRHKKEKHIRLTISLDLYEMLYFIQQGFSPSLNDLRGKFVELIIFKNLLENLIYDEVVVTKDNHTFYSIRKSAADRLRIQPFNI